jgi:hypothetical protein
MLTLVVDLTLVKFTVMVASPLVVEFFGLPLVAES